MSLNNLLLIFSIVISFSCSNAYNQPDALPIFVQIDSDDIKDNIRLSTIVKDIEYVKLETTDQAVIGNIDKILFYKDNIFVWDRFVTKSIYQYTLNGEFVRKIGRQGKGPGEYMLIDDFAIDEDRNEIIFCDSQSLKLLYYNMDGGFKDEKALTYFTSALKPFGKYFLFYLYGTNDEMPYNLLLVDKETLQVKDKCLGFIKGKDDLTIGAPFVNHLDNLLFTYSLAHEIYGVQMEKEKISLKPKYKIDFKKAVPAGEVENKELKDVVSFLQNSDLAYHVFDYFETDKLFGFSFIYLNEPHIAFFDKTSGKVLLSKGFLNDVDGKVFTRPITIFNNSLVSVLYPFELKENGLDLEINENHNPILAFGALK